MRHSLLSCLYACLSLCSAASAGGAAARVPAAAVVAPFGTPHPALSASTIQPGQVWELAGITAGGVRVSRVLKLSFAAPQWDAAKWTVKTDTGEISIMPTTRLMLITDVAGVMEQGKPVLFCLGFIDQATPPNSARTGRGLLLSGTFGQIDTELQKLRYKAEPTTLEGLAPLLRSAGVNAGICSLTRR